VFQTNKNIENIPLGNEQEQSKGSAPIISNLDGRIDLVYLQK
jgi:hypothetical protein